MFPDGRKLALFNVLPIYENASRMGGVEAKEKAENSRLAAAGWTDDGGFGACRDSEGERAEDLSGRVVAEGDILEGDGTTGEDEGLGGGRILREVPIRGLQKIWRMSGRQTLGGVCCSCRLKRTSMSSKLCLISR